MKALIEITRGGEMVNTFSIAGAFYSLCKENGFDVSTVANMMLLEATNEANQTMYNSNCYVRSDTE